MEVSSVQEYIKKRVLELSEEPLQPGFYECCRKRTIDEFLTLYNQIDQDWLKELKENKEFMEEIDSA